MAEGWQQLVVNSEDQQGDPTIGPMHDSATPGPPKIKQKSKPKVADSWEDESISSESSEDEKNENAANNIPSPPAQVVHDDDGPPLVPSAAPYRWSSSSSPSIDVPRKRPEKQTAVASRIISNALGVRTKRTEEQKAYDRAMMENERKRRERERELSKQKQAEEEKAKQAVWES
ncbi:hypothetical protein PRK78_001271 [Emydomyces testavorans]|uniref:Uncharacterized protein n=1 Tax=Emydomyces testavorans TaxID=2070801 RepID=A0AAF0DCN2_9EURO|nr:hypothetical protein PRK78_001271 [Emydomyces testavorans]